MMAVTLTIENQNSSSPKSFTEIRLTPKRTSRKTRAETHCGMSGNQYVHVHGGGGDFGDAGDDPDQPVRPAGDEAEERAEELAGVLREGARDRAVHEQFAERPHDEEDDQAGDGVHEDQAGSGLGDGLARAEEEAGADGAADRDHLDLAAAEPALVPLVRGAVVRLPASRPSCRLSTCAEVMVMRLSPCRSAPSVAADRVPIPPDMDGVCLTGGLPARSAPAEQGWRPPGGREDLSRAATLIRRDDYVAHATGKSGQRRFRSRNNTGRSGDGIVIRI